MSNLSIPNDVTNGIPADGNEVGANFDAIQAWADTHVVEAATRLADRTPAVFTRSSSVTATDSTDIGNDPAVDVVFESESGDTDGLWTSGSTLTIVNEGLYVLAVEANFVSKNNPISTCGIAPSVTAPAGWGAGFLNVSHSVTFSDSDGVGVKRSNHAIAWLPAGTTIKLQASANKPNGGANISVVFNNIKYRVLRLTGA